MAAVPAGLGIGMAALLGLAFPANASERCAGILPGPSAPDKLQRPLEPIDLVRLRDIGASYTVPSSAKAFSISPDGKRVAFQIRQADPGSNGYCLTMVVVDLRHGSLPKIVDSGGDYIRWSFEFRGKAGFPSGLPVTVTPHWSPDGRWIAFLKKVGSTTQAWLARTDGSGSSAITKASTDVVDLGFAADGRGIIFATRPGLVAASAKIDQEAWYGFQFDDRYSPMTRSRPFAVGPMDEELFVLDIASGVVRQADAAESRAFLQPSGSIPDAVEVALSTNGKAAWVIPPQGDDFFWNRRLAFQDGSGETQVCRATPCSSWVSKPWWTTDGRHVRFFRREGWAESVTAIYEWTPATGRLRRLYRTEDLLVQCEPWKGRLICLQESSINPRRLVAIDLDRGEATELFDPNPEFLNIRLGATERLRFKNDFGIESYADLVFPVGYEPGKKYPLVIVQYETRGFLRGGTGDEYPIQAFANRGYMVLSFARPRDIGYFRAKDEAGVSKADTEDFADRKSVQSSLREAIQILADRGLIDRDKIGITGLSDGASTVLFGLINDPMFAAAAISNCCFDPTSMLLVGPTATRHFVEEGYPAPTATADDFWKRISLARNAEAVRTPILMQLSDDEYLTALESYTALRQANGPVELYVYPDEHHIKWQPAHRLSIYERSIAWFDYWLKDIRPSYSRAATEVPGWDRLREARR
ncbi:Atxe2 family lasso peptide isopeptidase [Sphingobium sp. H39-3-25]|uniref:Atxe2 family lasso peptide isopeptidase n=1 Tax=Sphingomonadales TaxID=204457 RepID=UPI0008371EE6|nr:MULTISPECIES: Atxe2 family lasso peptide isopeptidase [Sphingomonadaceae]MDF0491135.1 Atxe2 family lasso peptide isopeptidase [Sphingomonas pollutisoli]MDF0545133.1 Atxe2 family lasso peptide isopeptidase [Sphingobium arseniciresistens]